MAIYLRRCVRSTRKLAALPRLLASSASSPFSAPDEIARDIHSNRSLSWGGVKFVPEKKAFLVERFGHYLKTLLPGRHQLIPLVDKIAYVHCLKEKPVPIIGQKVYCKDNVLLDVDSIIYLKVVDPYQASYGVEDPVNSILQVARALVRTELAKLDMDQIFQAGDMLNESIQRTLNEVVKTWGMECIRYGITEIRPPHSIELAMEFEAIAKLNRLARIKEGEGRRHAILRESQGEAAAIRACSQAHAHAIRKVSEALQGTGGLEAANLKAASDYVEAFGNVAKTVNVVVFAGDGNGLPQILVMALNNNKLKVSSFALDPQVNGGTGGEDPEANEGRTGDQALDTLKVEIDLDTRFRRVVDIGVQLYKTIEKGKAKRNAPPANSDHSAAQKEDDLSEDLFASDCEL